MFFNSDDVEEMDDFDVLPAGNYKVVIDSAEMKVTKTQTGRYVGVQLEVISGTGQGRKLFSNFNLENPNELAAKIGRSDFAKFLKAVGVAALASENDLVRLAGKSLNIELKIKTAKNGAAENKIVYLEQATRAAGAIQNAGATGATRTTTHSSQNGMNVPANQGQANVVYDAAGNVVPF